MLQAGRQTLVRWAAPGLAGTQVAAQKVDLPSLPTLTKVRKPLAIATSCASAHKHGEQGRRQALESCGAPEGGLTSELAPLVRHRISSTESLSILVLCIFNFSVPYAGPGAGEGFEWERVRRSMSACMHRAAGTFIEALALLLCRSPNA